MKKIFSIILVLSMFSTISVSANEPDSSLISDYSVEESFIYDGETEVLLDSFNVIDSDSTQYIQDGKQRRVYYEYTNYKVYDQGITSSWSYRSNPYFVISIAKGQSISGTKTVSGTLSATVGGDYPSAAKSNIFKNFGISASGSKTMSTTILYSGPGEDSNARSRDFYYQLGRHTHKVKIVEEKGNNWDGVTSTKEYSATVGNPAIKNYSQDTY